MAFWSNHRVLACAVIGTLLVGTQGHADEPVGAGVAADNGELGEITVTARRRDENIERVPATITAFNAQQLDERNIVSESDLQNTVPGLTIRQSEGSNELTYSIRGQTREANSGSASAVVPYFDEVQLNNGGASSFYDLDSIQVLKGPQGTLFGRNATGGAVLYTSKKPTDDTGGYLKLRLGNYGLAEGEGALNLPIITDKVLLRIAFDVEHRDGYVRNIYYGTDIGDIQRKSGRATLTIKPIDGLQNTTVFQYTVADGSSTGASYLNSVNPCGAVNNGAALTCASAGLYNPAAFNAAFGVGAWNAYLALHPHTNPNGLLAYLADANAAGVWVTDSPILSRHRENDWFVANTTSYELSEGMVLKNIVGASRSDEIDDVIETGDPYGIEYTENLLTGQYGNRITIEQISDELQLQGKLFNDSLTYITGVYAQKTDDHQFSPQTYFNVEPFGATGATADYTLHDQTEAIYAQGTYDLAPLVQNLSFTAGVRYTWEQLHVDHNPGGTYYPAARQSVGFSDPSWDVGFEYQATPDLMAYLKTRGSFRSGGLNGFAPPKPVGAAGGGDIFNSETIHDVEAGVKFAGHLGSIPAHLNASVYQEWINNIQRTQFPIVNGASIAVTVNVPKAEVRGVELETVFELTPWLDVGLSGAYTQARYTSNLVVLFGVSYQYGPYADTPEVTGTAFTKVKLPIPENLGKLDVRLDGYVQTDQYFSNTAATVTPGTRLPGYALLNSRLDWNDIGGTKLNAALFAKNMLNRSYLVGGLAQGSSLGLNGAAVGEPREYGLELGYRF